MSNTSRIIDVEIRGKVLAYRCAEPVEVGDEVTVPAPWWAPNRSVTPRWTGTVRNLDSTYDGAVINCRVIRTKS